MGFQNDNDNSQGDYNVKADAKSHQRTSKTVELCNTTSKCQYERLSTSKAVGTGDI